jgi:hypothetical protein
MIAGVKVSTRPHRNLVKGGVLAAAGAGAAFEHAQCDTVRDKGKPLREWGTWYRSAKQTLGQAQI